MKRIASFTVNHDTLEKGMYISRIDGDVVTYDIRMKLPNGGDYLQMSAAHTLEHLFATYVRNSEFADKIIYFGPMGCRTGFYFITLDSLSKSGAIALTRSALKFCAEFTGEIPGVSAEECGNYLDHDLFGARKESALMYEVIESWTPEQLEYPTK